MPRKAYLEQKMRHKGFFLHQLRRSARDCIKIMLRRIYKDKNRYVPAQSSGGTYLMTVRH